MNLVIEEKELKHLPITTDPEIMSGAPVFRGTRVPIDALMNNLEAGDSTDKKARFASPGILKIKSSIPCQSGFISSKRRRVNLTQCKSFYF
jgi:hypothetical protein